MVRLFADCCQFATFNDFHYRFPEQGTFSVTRKIKFNSRSTQLSTAPENNSTSCFKIQQTNIFYTGKTYVSEDLTIVTTATFFACFFFFFWRINFIFRQNVCLQTFRLLSYPETDVAIRHENGAIVSHWYAKLAHCRIVATLNSTLF